jgi:protein-disulfide isomerase
MLILVLLFVPFSATAQRGLAKPSGLCVFGKHGAPVMIEIFSDYQCHACRTFFLETLEPLMRDYVGTNKLCLMYHDFPVGVHSYTRLASEYAIAVRLLFGQEKWQGVSEFLYKEQSQWMKDGKVEAIVARALSADEMVKVREFLKDPSIEQTIDQELARADKLKITATPTFFISSNGREQRVVGAVSYPVLKDYLDRLLRKTR